ncbi:MAG: hypothetical protein COA70_03330 [Planctomycetota bacterium]|nr:MAG: hypothetical protein COA70_03330 [Planctomycetota bacterium]
MFLALALTLAAHGGVDLDREGPPAICQPFDIGDAASLPWKAGAFEADTQYDLALLNHDLAKILDSNDDAMVRMESIRRAVIYVSGFSQNRKKLSAMERKLASESLVSMLRARALAPHIYDKVATEERTAPRLFDLGFALGALRQLEWREEYVPHLGNGEAELEKAAAWEKASAAMHLGMALALWGSDRTNQRTGEYFLSAAKLAGPDQGRLSKNILVCAKRIYNVDTYDELVSHLSKQIASS